MARPVWGSHGSCARSPNERNGAASGCCGPAATTRLPRCCRCSPRSRPLIDQARNGRRPDLSDDDVDALNLLTRSRRRSTGGRRCSTAAHRRHAAVSRRVPPVARCGTIPADPAGDRRRACARRRQRGTDRPPHRGRGAPVRGTSGASADPIGGPPGRRTTGRSSNRSAGYAPNKAVPSCCSKGLHEVDLNELLASFGPAPPSRPLLRSDAQPHGWQPTVRPAAVDAPARQRRRGRRRTIASCWPIPRRSKRHASGLDEVVDERVDALRQVVS